MFLQGLECLIRRITVEFDIKYLTGRKFEAKIWNIASVHLDSNLRQIELFNLY